MRRTMKPVGALSPGAALGLVLTSLAFGSSMAFATNWGSQGDAENDWSDPDVNGVWLTNNDNFWVGRWYLTTTYANGVDDAMEELDDVANGDFNTTTQSTTSCPDSTYDACVMDYNYGANGYNGWNQCAGTTSGSHPNQVCSVCYVRINTFYSPPAKRIACHELGHAMGLRHTSSQSSCMKTTSSGGTSSSLSFHDLGHILDEY